MSDTNKLRGKVSLLLVAMAKRNLDFFGSYFAVIGLAVRPKDSVSFPTLLTPMLRPCSEPPFSSLSVHHITNS